MAGGLDFKSEVFNEEQLNNQFVFSSCPHQTSNTFPFSVLCTFLISSGTNIEIGSIIGFTTYKCHFIFGSYSIPLCLNMSFDKQWMKFSWYNIGGLLVLI